MQFGIPRPVPTVLIPADALLFNADGLRVASVDDAGRVHLHKVTVYRDYGTKLQLREGLKGGERVALSPSRRTSRRARRSGWLNPRPRRPRRKNSAAARETMIHARRTKLSGT